MIPRRLAQKEKGEWALLQKWMAESDASATAFLQEWEQKLAAYIGVPDVAAVSSGRQALRLILEHLGVGAGDELIVPAYTLGEMLPFVASLGVTLVPADIDPESMNITPETVAHRLTGKTRAILALHIFGVPCDIQGIRALADHHGVKVIEDCAHSLGARVQGRPTGSFGDASFFSFKITKMINTYGGGLVASSTRPLVDAARAFNNSEPPGYTTLENKMQGVRLEESFFRRRLMYLPLFMLASPAWQPLMNRLYRSSQQKQKKREQYSDVQARLGLIKLAHLEERTALRQERIALMNSLLHEDIRPQQVREGDSASGYFYVVRLPVKAAAVRRRLLFRGIDAGAGNEIMDHCAAQLGYTDCPGIDTVFEHALALPMYDGIKEKDCEQVILTLNKVLA